MHARGQYALAATMLDDPATRASYDARPGEQGKDTLLWYLERGAVALALNDPDKTIECLEVAEPRTRYNYKQSADDSARAWVFTNDRDTRYVAAPYEDMYVNVLKLLAELAAGRLQGGATVEAYRVGDKSDYLRELMKVRVQAVENASSAEYEKARAAEKQARFNDSSLSGIRSHANAGVYVESTLATFLSTITFMKVGEVERQRQDAGRLRDAINQQADIGGVRASDFAGLEALRADDVNTLVVGLSGCSPRKIKRQYGPIFLWQTSINIVLPEMVPERSRIIGAVLEVEGLPQASQELRLVEDMARVSEENFRRELPAIYTRTFTRAFIKALEVGLLTYAADRSSSQTDAWRALVRVAGFLYVWGTEDADTRSWVMLPGQARAAWLKLPAGQHRVRVVYRLAGGGSAPDPWRAITVSDDSLTTILSNNPN